jgi:hypothetical protein
MFLSDVHKWSSEDFGMSVVLGYEYMERRLMLGIQISLNFVFQNVVSLSRPMNVLWIEEKLTMLVF